uniref:Uncharacterized protein n=1 Tax=Helianthus annuus TaxID=4232 RepID=A0A251T7W4_HELAN
MVGPANGGRTVTSRQVLSVVNGGQDPIIRKCDAMADYIKRLKMCIKWFQELEADLLLEQDKHWKCWKLQKRNAMI